MATVRAPGCPRASPRVSRPAVPRAARPAAGSWPPAPVPARAQRRPGRRVEPRRRPALELARRRLDRATPRPGRRSAAMTPAGADRDSSTRSATAASGGTGHPTVRTGRRIGRDLLVLLAVATLGFTATTA